ncbi:hypothetical protein LXL04_013997 [Taraxacum kok-saghyz]
MAAAKRKKRAATIDDLPEALQLRILAYLNAKDAVQTMILSKTWVSLWTRIPVLEFNYFSFKYLNVFNKFVNEVLRRRDHSARLDSLKFIDTIRSSTQLLNRVFDYAFSHGVKQLEASIQSFGRNSWPVSLCNSLTSLKLQSRTDKIDCPFLGPGSTSFKNLTDLHLYGVRITSIEPFSGFPMLENLTLLYSELSIYGSIDQILRVYSLGLLHLTISGCTRINRCELRTPRLKFMEYRGYDFPKHEENLSDLETLVIDYRGFYRYSYMGEQQEKQLNEDLLCLFSRVPNVKSLTLFSPTFHLLHLFPYELERRSSPFRELKKLKLDFRVCCRRSVRLNSFDKYGKGYFLPHVPVVEFSVTCPQVYEWSADDLSDVSEFN